ncbi:MAG TPA: family 78 glycoside hydrolase catalytic domain [Lacunisphaera sp.]|nr:family 78 glycoside hydrolase catalytic domain [Lacunisphaera sp.]
MFHSQSAQSSARLIDLRCEHLFNPLGLDETEPRFSWKMVDARLGAGQTAYELVVASNEARARAGLGDIWSSGKVVSKQSHLVVYNGEKLSAHTRYFWCVRIWDHLGKVTQWSDVAWWETGFLGLRWPAVWIGVSKKDEKRVSPARYLRHGFELPEAPASARLYISALGLFEPYLNGQRVGRDVLAPGWTDYQKRVEYLSYNVSALIKPGRNALGAILADGWFCGFLGWQNQRNHYGATPALLAVLRLVLGDGTVRWIGTTTAWKSVPGPILAADLYHGETYDARVGNTAWAGGNFPDANHPAVRPITTRPVSIFGKATPPVRAIEEIVPQAVTQPTPSCFVYDLGQNMVGVVRLSITAPRGTRLRLRYAEMINSDGTIYTANLRSAQATDYYICRGGEKESYEPRFTFHGFRYVELTGLPNKPALSAITGIVWHSDLRQTGSFSCSNKLLNQLQSNIRWGQRGNFLDVPTDCPQRDERLGWTGDAQVFATTAAFNYDVSTFFRKWLQDLRDGQHPNGEYPDVAPDVLCLAARKDAAAWLKHGNKGNAAWADAGVICPWVIYRRYGDARVLAENYTAMAKWISFQERTSRKLIRPDTNYGDWLATDAVSPHRAPTPCDLIGTAYFAHTTGHMIKIATILGKTLDAATYRQLHSRIVAAFNHEFVSASGRITGDTQTGYLLALAFDLLPQRLRRKAVARLVHLIEKNQNRLATGFIGTPLLGPVLTRFGRVDVAYRLLLQREYPSWLYPILNGATTMWERWNSWTKETGFGEAGMNSFNHYAYGAIGEWLYANVTGIDFAPSVPGGRRLLLHPQLGGGLTYARAKLWLPYGEIRSAWKLRGRIWTWDVTIPPNVSASAELPTNNARAVRINQKPLGSPAGISSLRKTNRAVVALLQSGNYNFVVTDPHIEGRAC